MELDTLKEKQQELWELINQNDSSEEASELFASLGSQFTNLIHSNDDSENHYEYMRFILRYMNESKNYNMDYSRPLIHHWKLTFENKNFPLELLTKLLNLVKEQPLNDYEVSEVTQFANSLFDHENYELAKTYYEALESKLDDSNTWDNWATCYVVYEDFEGTIDILNRAQRQIPDSDHIANNRAFYLIRLSRYDEALMQLSEVIERSEKNKYWTDHFYNYAVNLKASLYISLDRPLDAFMEKSRLLSTYSCDKDEIVNSAKELLS